MAESRIVDVAEIYSGDLLIGKTAYISADHITAGVLKLPTEKMKPMICDRCGAPMQDDAKCEYCGTRYR